jgi:hypothetical protein
MIATNQWLPIIMALSWFVWVIVFLLAPSSRVLRYMIQVAINFSSTSSAYHSHAYVLPLRQTASATSPKQGRSTLVLTFYQEP